MSVRPPYQASKSIPRQNFLICQVAGLSLLPAISGWLPVAVALEVPQIPIAADKTQHIAQLVGDNATHRLRDRALSRPQLFVNPATGHDITGDGSIAIPFKTITQALKVARPNAVIQLAAGTYSDRTGEVFPLKLQPEVTILGNPSTRGQNIAIIGGSYYLSPTFARQNITILGADKATIAGVTVTNPNPRGYALWIESSSPTVTDNTFRDSSHDGISIVGKSEPLIRGNYFSENGANGITIYGKSRPQVRDNIVENTGFGINIAQNSAPMLIGNRIAGNKDGVVVQGNALPVLLNNTIERNTRYGLVAIANSQPNLGTPRQPGGNIFRHNGELDVNAKASTHVVPAFGNQLTQFHTRGDIDFQGVVSLVEPIPQRENRPTAASFPVPSRSNRPTLPSPTVASQTNPSQISVPPPPSGLESQPSTSRHQIPTVSSQVPSLGPLPDVSISNTAELGTVRVSGNSGWRSASPQPPTRATALGLRYRVVVNAANSMEQTKVRQIVPDAFRSFSNGRSVMQAGAFASLNEAKELLQRLTSYGLRATIEDY